MDELYTLPSPAGDGDVVVVLNHADEARATGDFEQQRRPERRGIFARIFEFIRDSSEFNPNAVDDDEDEDSDSPLQKSASGEETDDVPTLNLVEMRPGVYQTVSFASERHLRHHRREPSFEDLVASANNHYGGVNENREIEDGNDDDEIYVYSSLLVKKDSLAAKYKGVSVAECADAKIPTPKRNEVRACSQKLIDDNCVAVDAELYWASQACERTILEAVGLLREANSTPLVVPTGGESGASREKRVHAKITQAVDLLLHLTQTEKNAQ